MEIVFTKSVLLEKLVMLGVISAVLFWLHGKFRVNPLTGRSYFWRVCLPTFIYDVRQFRRTEGGGPWHWAGFGALAALCVCLPVILGEHAARAGVFGYWVASKYGFPVVRHATPALQSSAWIFQALFGLVLLNFSTPILLNHSRKAKAILRAILLKHGLPDKYDSIMQLDESRVLFIHGQPVAFEKFQAARGDIETGAGMVFQAGLKGMFEPVKGAVMFVGEWTRMRERHEPVITGVKADESYWYALEEDGDDGAPVVVKLGRSKRPFERLDELRTGNSRRLDFYHRRDGLPAIFVETELMNERTMHVRFKKQRLMNNAEWFALSEELQGILEGTSPAEIARGYQWSNAERAALV